MKSLALIVLLLITPAMAQQSSDPAFMQKAINSVIGQRNNALNLLAETEARLLLQLEENAKLKAENEELKKKLPADPPK